MSSLLLPLLLLVTRCIRRLGLVRPGWPDWNPCRIPSAAQAVEAWEQRVVRYGQGQLGALEDRLGALEEHVARIGRENLQELSQLGERIRWARASCCLLPGKLASRV